MQALIDQLQGKIKSYKKQIEEAEEIAALNLAKYAVTSRIRAFLLSSISPPQHPAGTDRPRTT